MNETAQTEAVAAHARAEKVAWDGEAQIYSAARDEFFENADDLGTCCYFAGVAAVDMLLYHCTPEGTPDLTRAVLLAEQDDAMFRP